MPWGPARANGKRGVLVHSRSVARGPRGERPSGHPVLKTHADGPIGNRAASGVIRKPSR